MIQALTQCLQRGSSASQMTAAKVMDVIARLPGCAGQAAGAILAYTQVKMEDAPSMIKIPKSECPDIWIRLPRHKCPTSWSIIEDPVVLVERNLYGHPFGRTVMGKAIRESSIWTLFGKKFQIWNACSLTERKDYSCLCMWTIFNWLERNRTSTERGKYSWKTLVWENRHLSSVMYTWVALNENVNKQRYCRELQKYGWIQNLCWSYRKSDLTLRNLAQTFSHGPVIWKVMRRNEWKEIANWRTTKQLNSFYKVATPCIDEEEMIPVGELSKVCSQIVLECLYVARIGRPDILMVCEQTCSCCHWMDQISEKRLACLIS